MIYPKRAAIIGADWPEYEKFCPNFTGMQKGLAALGIEYRLFSCRPILNVDALIEYEPDFVVYGLIDMVRAKETRMKIRRALPDARIVMWYGDLRNNETGQIRADMSEIDMMFVSNAAQGEYYESLWKVPSCRFLPLGSPVWDAPFKTKYDLDFIFLGAVITGKGFMERARIMMDLRSYHNLTIIDAPAQRKPELRAKILKEMPSIYRSAKVSLDWSHFTDILGYTSNRFWIITAAGGFALTKRWPGCTDFYPEGTRAYFDTMEEAIELRNYYLQNPEKREEIRAKGHIHARLHTYEHRFDIMFRKVYGVPKSENRLPLPVLQTPGAQEPKGQGPRVSKKAHPQAHAHGAGA